MRCEPKRRRLSRSKAAVAARRRRAHERGVRDELAHEHQEREGALATRARAQGGRRFGTSVGSPSPGWRRSAPPSRGWSGARSTSRTRRPARARCGCWWAASHRRTRSDTSKPARALQIVRDDVELEKAIDPQRLSQIRVVYRDPRGVAARRLIVSKIGAWEFIVSDLVFELVGMGPNDGDALAVRYAENLTSRRSTCAAGPGPAQRPLAQRWSRRELRDPQDLRHRPDRLARCGATYDAMRTGTTYCVGQVGEWIR